MFKCTRTHVKLNEALPGKMAAVLKSMATEWQALCAYVGVVD